MIDTAGIALAQVVGRGDQISTLVESEFFAFALPFLFAFAVVYGLLENAGIPKDDAPRIVIALAAGFLILPVAPSLTGILTSLSSGLVVAFGALLILVILFELLGIKTRKTVPVQTEEGVKGDVEEMSIFKAHRRAFMGVIFIILVLIFANAGGFQQLGLPTPRFLFNSPLILFLIFIIAIVWWVSAKE